MFNKILCPTDGSDHAYKALDLAIDMAKKYEAEIVILHVPYRSENIDDLQRFAETEGLAKHVNTEIDRLKSMDYRVTVATGSTFQDSGVSPQLLFELGQYIIDGAKGRARQKGLENVDARLEAGDPADRILECIDAQKIDCVIMGSRGFTISRVCFLAAYRTRRQTAHPAPASLPGSRSVKSAR